MFAQIYWQIATMQEESLASNVLRNGVILMSFAPIATCAFVFYIIIVIYKWKPVATSAHITTDMDMEAAALREALAIRKEKNSN
jgi:hypothetical protein